MRRGSLTALYLRGDKGTWVRRGTVWVDPYGRTCSTSTRTVRVLARFGGAETYFIKYCTVVATVRVYLPCMHSVWGTALILRGDESVMHAYVR